MDDFQEQTIEQKVREHEVFIASSGYSVEQVTAALIGVSELFTIVFESISEKVKALSEKLGEEFPALVEGYMSTLEDDWELDGKREIYKLDFKRPNISHQVVDRKPKQLIKKVIY